MVPEFTYTFRCPCGNVFTRKIEDVREIMDLQRTMEQGFNIFALFSTCPACNRFTQW